MLISFLMISSTLEFGDRQFSRSLLSHLWLLFAGMFNYLDASSSNVVSLYYVLLLCQSVRRIMNCLWYS